MKKGLTSTTNLILFAIMLFAMQTNISCKKNKDDVAKSYPIQGLWIGTATFTPTSSNSPYFFSLSIYPDGTISYKSTPPGHVYFATGTWSLTGTTLSFSVTLINSTGSQSQTGTATYSSANATLTNGDIFETSLNVAKWTMTRVN